MQMLVEVFSFGCMYVEQLYPIIQASLSKISEENYVLVLFKVILKMF